MAKNGELEKINTTVSEKTLHRAAELERLGNRAVHQAQEENRRRGIPNWYSINGHLVNDIEPKKD